MDDMNRKCRLTPLNPRGERHTDPVGSGNAAQDGFTRLYRRPRVAGEYDCMPLDKADRVEDFDHEMREMMAGYDD